MRLEASIPPRGGRSEENPEEKSWSLLDSVDVHLFNEGTHCRLYNKLGAHPCKMNGVSGTYFAVWAPDADKVSVIGDFNHWTPDHTILRPKNSSGIWEAFVPGITAGTLYKYHVAATFKNYQVAKADPFAFRSELPPKTASIVEDLSYAWNDATWMKQRPARNQLNTPISIYEVHLGSWMRVPEEDNRFLTYRELAPLLCEYVQKLGFTHIELMPIMEHPFYASWGYQVTGYFAPTSRYGSPEDFMYFVDYMHQHDIGVLLDWVPGHFPTDQHGLGYFDGTHLYEHADARQGFHPDWKSFIFNYGRNEVRSFLLSSAVFWLDRYHIDGLRVDGVASMLYLDYSREDGEWIPNRYGGNENLEAISFLRKLNEVVYELFPDVQTIAEESTAWPGVSRPTYVGGLGFGLKWDMGWMHDTLLYMSRDSVFRKYHQHELSFRALYANHENFVLPLSHDEVVHGKGALLTKMPGDEWQRFANLRLLYGYMFGTPGKKLLFMGGEFGQWKEWDHDQSLDWHLAQYDRHKAIQLLVAELNRVYRREAALHSLDMEPNGFEWVDHSDREQSVVAFLRFGIKGVRPILVVCNFTPVPRHHYRLGVPEGGYWRELFNSDATDFCGSGCGNFGGVQSDAISSHGRPYSLRLTLPPLAVLYLQPT